MFLKNAGRMVFPPGFYKKECALAHPDTISYEKKLPRPALSASHPCICSETTGKYQIQETDPAATRQPLKGSLQEFQIQN